MSPPGGERWWGLVRDLPAGALLQRRRALLGVVGWSLPAVLPSLVSGRLIALAVDRGFLAGRPVTGLAWLAGLGLAICVGALGARRVPVALGRVVEPLRDRLLDRVVTGTLRRAVLGTEPADAAVVARMSEQVETVRNASAGLLLGLHQVVFTVGAAAIGLFLLAPVVSVLVVPPVLLAVLILGRLLPVLVARQRASLMAEEGVAETVGRIGVAVRDLVACGATARATADATADIDRQVAAARAVARATTLRTAVGLIGGQLPLVAVLAAAPWLLRTGRLSPGEMLGAVTYVTANLQPALRSAVQTLGGSGVLLAVTAHRLRVMSDPPAAPAVPTNRARTPAAYDVEVEGLTFSYGAAAQPVVEELSLSLRHGDGLAVVGPSGIGKSTLADLLVGLTVPQRGTVAIGGVPIQEVEEEWLRRTVAIIPQEAYVFAGTLRENLVYLLPDADRRAIGTAELDAVAEILGMETLRDRLGGHDGTVRSRADLTPGERQLVALARVWLSPAEIVVLDEATCHLDPVTEDRVEKAFGRRGGTLVVIAHRLSSARRADRVLVMDGARPMLGTHDELMPRSPTYAELVGAWRFDPRDHGR